MWCGVIEVATPLGPIRAEGFPVRFTGWDGFQFYAHHSVDGGDIDPDRWIVSEVVTGRAITWKTFPTADDAIAGARQFLRKHSPARIRRDIERLAGANNG